MQSIAGQCAFVISFFLLSNEEDNSFFDGLIGQPRIYNKVLTKGQVCSISQMCDREKYKSYLLNLEHQNQDNKNDAFLVTTEKDHVRIPDEFKSSVGIIYGEIVSDNNIEFATEIEKYI